MFKLAQRLRPDRIKVIFLPYYCSFVQHVNYAQLCFCFERVTGVERDFDKSVFVLVMCVLQPLWELARVLSVPYLYSCGGRVESAYMSFCTVSIRVVVIMALNIKSVAINIQVLTPFTTASTFIFTSTFIVFLVFFLQRNGFRVIKKPLFSLLRN